MPIIQEPLNLTQIDQLIFNAHTQKNKGNLEDRIKADFFDTHKKQNKKQKPRSKSKSKPKSRSKSKPKSKSRSQKNRKNSN